MRSRTTTFLKHLWRGGNTANLFLISPPDQHGNEQKETHWFDVPNIPNLTQTGKYERYNFYFSMHPTNGVPKRFNSNGDPLDPSRFRTRNSDVCAVNCFFADIDDQHASLDDLPIPPSAIIETSPQKYHCYWLFHDPYHITNEEERDYIRTIQAAWVTALGVADEAAKDLSRCPRLPGHYNPKEQYTPNYPMVDFTHTDLKTLYTIDDIVDKCKHCIPKEEPRATSSTTLPINHFNPATNSRVAAYAAKTLEQATMDVAQAAKGTRNRTLYNKAFWLGKFVSEGLLDEHTVRDLLLDAAHRNGSMRDPSQNPRETIKNGLRDGGRKGLSENDLPNNIFDPPATSTTTQSHSQLSSTPPQSPPAHQTSAAEPPKTEKPTTASINISPFYTNNMPDIPTTPLYDWRCWLDDYIDFSRMWSPRSWHGFHEDCGVWLLSTIAGRRVAYQLGKRRYTSLYIALCARSSMWAKSTATEIANHVLRHVGLHHFLVPDEVTPQAFIKHLTTTVPNEWKTLDAKTKNRIKERLRFAAQRGWFYEEFGQKLSSMMRENGIMADFRGILRRFDDHAEEYDSATITRGVDHIDRPYLSLLANVTPADLKPYAAKGAPLWHDGFFARFGFSVPDENTPRSTAQFPEGERSIPNLILEPLSEWHKQLGIPNIDIYEKTDGEEKPTGFFHVEVKRPQEHNYSLGKGVREAYYQYHDALINAAEEMDEHDFDSSYARFAEKAIRIATLLASIERKGTNIELWHWARAQRITERWRRGLHTLVNQLQTNIEYEEDHKNEQRILAFLERAGKPIRERDIYRELKIAPNSAKLILSRLKEEGYATEQRIKNPKGRPSTLWEIG